MSVELGAYITDVYVTEDGLNGSTKAALQHTKLDIVRENGEPKTVNALTEVIENASLRSHVVDRFRNSGRFLMGTYDGYMNLEQRPQRPFDAILYAEAEGLLDSGAFSVIRMATWVRRSVTEKVVYLGETSLERQLADRMVVDVADSRSSKTGIPVARLSVVRSFDVNDRGYVFGHHKDLEAINELEVPERLKGMLHALATAYQTSELLHSGNAVFADVLDALDDRNF